MGRLSSIVHSTFHKPQQEEDLAPLEIKHISHPYPLQRTNSDHHQKHQRNASKSSLSKLTPRRSRSKHSPARPARPETSFTEGLEEWENLSISSSQPQSTLASPTATSLIHTPVHTFIRSQPSTDVQPPRRLDFSRSESDENPSQITLGSVVSTSTSKSQSVEPVWQPNGHHHSSIDQPEYQSPGPASPEKSSDSLDFSETQAATIGQTQDDDVFTARPSPELAPETPLFTRHSLPLSDRSISSSTTSPPPRSWSSPTSLFTTGPLIRRLSPSPTDEMRQSIAEDEDFYAMYGEGNEEDEEVSEDGQEESGYTHDDQDYHTNPDEDDARRSEDDSESHRGDAELDMTEINEEDILELGFGAFGSPAEQFSMSRQMAKWNWEFTHQPSLMSRVDEIREQIQTETQRREMERARELMRYVNSPARLLGSFGMQRGKSRLSAVSEVAPMEEVPEPELQQVAEPTEEPSNTAQPVPPGEDSTKPVSSPGLPQKVSNPNVPPSTPKRRLQRAITISRSAPPTPDSKTSSSHPRTPQRANTISGKASSPGSGVKFAPVFYPVPDGVNPASQKRSPNKLRKSQTVKGGWVMVGVSDLTIDHRTKQSPKGRKTTLLDRFVSLLVGRRRNRNEVRHPGLQRIK